MATEKELDRALAAELEANPTFLSWLLSQTKFAGRDATFHSCRANHPWGSHPFPSVNPDSGEAFTTTRQSETDVLLIVSDQAGQLFGVHIENKTDSATFTDLQPEMYPHRASHWIGNAHYGGYSDFDTILLAPEAFKQRHPSQAALFGRFISHETVGEYIPLFRLRRGAS